MDVEDNVASVEIYYGDELLEVFDEAPFEVSLPLSSIDTGLQTFRAVATDQTDLSAEDDLQVSINISGGNVLGVERNLFDGALLASGPFLLGGGGVSVHDSRVYISAVSADGSGRLVSLLPELEPQWTQNFANGLRAPAQRLSDGQLALGTIEGGNWAIRILDPTSGDTVNSWILGAAPSEYGGFGPQLAALSDGIYATGGLQSVNRYSVDGTDQGTVVETGHGVITGIAVGPSDDVGYLSYGDAFEAETESCATSSDFCALAVSPEGGVEWITGLAKQFAGVHRIAPALDGGAFLAASVPNDSENGYLLLRVSPTGVVEDSQLHGSAGSLPVDDDDDFVAALAMDAKGGVVACGSRLVEEGVFTTFVALFDASLNVLWEVRDIFESTGGAATLGCASSDQSVFVYGIENLSFGDVGADSGATGDAWVARISL